MRTDGKNTVHYVNGSNSDIQRVIEANFLRALKQVQQDGFCKQFKGYDAKETAENVWNYLKRNIEYSADGDYQDIRLPARFVSDKKGDCKSYALFSACLMACFPDQVKSVYFRYTSYDGNKIPTHIYTVIVDNKGHQIIIDGVWNYFNSEKQFTYKKDVNMPTIRTLSGVDNKINQQSVGAYTFAVLKNLSAAYNEAAARKDAKTMEFFKRRIQHYKAAAGIDKPSINGVKSLVKNIDLKHLGPKALEAAKKLVKDEVKGVKVIALAPGRADFLLLVMENFRGLASRLAAMDQAKVKHFWVDTLGGQYDKLEKAIEKGAKKKPLFGAKKIKGIGVVDPASLTAIVTTALPVIQQIFAFFKKNGHGKPGDDNAASLGDGSAEYTTVGVDPKNIPPVGEANGVVAADHGTGEDHDSKHGSNMFPLVLGGSALALLALKH